MPRDSQCRSPEISSNPNLCNLSPDPGIVSWTASPSMPHSVWLSVQWNNTTQEGCQMYKSCHNKKRSDTDLFFMCEGSSQTCSARTNCKTAAFVAVTGVACSAAFPILLNSPLAKAIATSIVNVPGSVWSHHNSCFPVFHSCQYS